MRQRATAARARARASAWTRVTAAPAAARLAAARGGARHGAREQRARVRLQDDGRGLAQGLDGAPILREQRAVEPESGLDARRRRGAGLAGTASSTRLTAVAMGVRLGRRAQRAAATASSGASARSSGSPAGSLTGSAVSELHQLGEEGLHQLSALAIRF